VTERQVPDASRLGPDERWLRSRAAATIAAVDDAMAEYAFGEVTRLVYDAIWNEYCDWGLELAKVRLTDTTLPVETHEATWWTLVEVLDTYLRLLHPVMPFLTEALWDAIPHRRTDPPLLIVARWPAPGPRDLAVESELDDLLQLIGALRNARSTAKLPAGARLETWVFVPTSLGPTFEALRPAIERLARAEPLHRVLTPEQLSAGTAPGDLSIVVPGGQLGAVIRPAAAASDTVAADRARLERELAEAEGFLSAARARLANDAFTSKAPAAVVETARAREAELADQVEQLRDRLGR
jgi:valyl-tRNA synthetase